MTREQKNEQLDTMWNFLKFKHGQKANIPALKENLDSLRVLLTQKSAGQPKYSKADYVSFDDLDTVVNCIVIESMQLYLSGDLDRLEMLHDDTKRTDLQEVR